MHRYLESKFWSMKSARMTTMAHFICVITQPFPKKCHIITTSDDLWVLYRAVTWSGFSYEGTLQVIYKWEKKISQIKSFSMPRELKQQSLSGRRKRDQKKDSGGCRVKSRSRMEDEVLSRQRYLSCYICWSHFPDNFSNFPNTPPSICN